VFGEEAASSASGAKAHWEEIKAAERAGKAAKRSEAPSLLDDVPNSLPALARSEKLSKRAATVGFDWPDWQTTLDKVREELDETASAAGGDTAKVHEELGDLLFAVANLARKLGVDAEAALRDANVKFTRRFHHVEARAAEDGVPLAEAGLERLDGYWNEIRARERS
jgi:MazG family protein